MESRGYDVKRARVYDSKGPLERSAVMTLICFICKCILRYPRQVITCGHRFCEHCVEELVSGSEGPYICPECREKFLKKDVHNDKACLKEIQALRVDCPYDCMWNGMLVDMESHEETCLKRVLLCGQGCGEQILKSDLDLHMSSVCSKRRVPCQFCNMNIPLDNMENHISTCEERPVDCDYCKQHLANQKRLSQHLEEECVECYMLCKYGDCKFKGKRSEMNQHISSTHSIQLLGLCNELKDENQKLRSEVTMCREEIKRLHKGRHEVQSEEESDPGSRQNSADWVQQCTDAMGTAEQQGPVPHQDYVESSEPHLQPVNQQLYDQSTGMKTSSLTSLTDYATAIEEVFLWQDKTEVKITDGLFVWKIPNVHQRYQEAVDGNSVSLCSPPFYTSPHGYCACLHACLDGDGDGKGAHISVYFFILRSQHDDQLPWPFKHMVRFTLINQTNPAASITEAFVPDLHSPSFQQPRFNMNIPCGFPKFAPCTKLEDENFTRDNTLIIHCHVDTKGLSLL